jgi:tRNA 2-thiouridine synthesizing protein C
MVAEKKKLLIALRQPPYSSSLPRTAVDTCLAAAAFDQPVSVLFMGDGVLQLLPGQDGDALATRTLSRIIASFGLYDIETLYVDAHALRDHAISPAELPEQVELLSQHQIQDLMAATDHLLSF